MESRNKTLEKTGRMVSVEYDKLVNIVFEAMDRYIKNENEDNPLEKNVLVVKKNGQLLQVPNIIQQDAITLYFEKYPENVKYFDLSNYYNDNYNDNDNYNENDNIDNMNKKSNTFLILFLVFLVLVVCMVVYFTKYN